MVAPEARLIRRSAGMVAHWRVWTSSSCWVGKPVTDMWVVPSMKAARAMIQRART